MGEGNKNLMKTEISKYNPFKCGRYAFAFEYIEERTKYLDYGCYDGYFIFKTLQKKKVNFIGIDKNKEIINSNPYNLNLKFFDSFPLPFKESEFDGVTLLDVLEHIYDQEALLKEINRILKIGGKLIITVPHKYFFSWLDLGNLKFIFPTFHKLFYILTHSKKEYVKKYRENPYGLIGDIEKEKAWHQHFTKKELTRLLKKNGFKVILYDGSNFFERLFILFDILKIGFLIPKFLRIWDCLKFESMNLFCVAIKIKKL